MIATPERTRCLVCRRPADFYVRSQDKFFRNCDEEFDLWRCGRCGLIFIWPEPPAEVLARHYPEGYGPHRGFDAHRSYGAGGSLRRILRRAALSYFLGYGPRRIWRILSYPYFLRIAHYPRAKRGGQLLDVGSGSGRFLWEMKQLGWEAVGVDSSEAATTAARGKGLEVKTGTVKDSHFPPNYFDAVTFHHSFEHLGNPRETLQELSRILKADGELILTIPNTKSFLARIFGRNWSGLEIPRHLYNYNSQNLAVLLGEAGFRITSKISLKILTTLLTDLGYTLERSGDFPLAGKANRAISAIEFFLDPLFGFFELGNEIVIRAAKA